MGKGDLSGVNGGMNGGVNGGWWQGNVMGFTSKQSRPRARPTSTPTTAECLTLNLPSNLGRLLHALHFARYGLHIILVQVLSSGTRARKPWSSNSFLSTLVQALVRSLSTLFEAHK